MLKLATVRNTWFIGNGTNWNVVPSDKAIVRVRQVMNNGNDYPEDVDAVWYDYVRESGSRFGVLFAKDAENVVLNKEYTGFHPYTAESFCYTDLTDAEKKCATIQTDAAYTGCYPINTGKKAAGTAFNSQGITPLISIGAISKVTIGSTILLGDRKWCIAGYEALASDALMFELIVLPLTDNRVL